VVVLFSARARVDNARTSCLGNQASRKEEASGPQLVTSAPNRLATRGR